jgi:ribose transport system permease protein
MEIDVAQKSSPSRSLFRSDAMQTVLAFGALVILILVFSLASENFRSFSNITGILIATAVNGVLALGVTFVIISGGIDLSIGTVMTLSAVMTGVFITNWGLPVPLGVLGGLATGALAGFINGVIIARFRIAPFIATLGMLNIAKGLSLVISNLKPIYFNDTPVVNSIAMGSVLGSVIPGFDIPNGVLIMFGAAIVAGIVLTKTVLGRYTFALGSNEEAARLSGVSVRFWKIAVYTATGLFSGLAGVLIASRLNSAQPALGQGYELDAHRLPRSLGARR